MSEFNVKKIANDDVKTVEQCQALSSAAVGDTAGCSVERPAGSPTGPAVVCSQGRCSSSVITSYGVSQPSYDSLWFSRKVPCFCENVLQYLSVSHIGQV